MNESSQNGHETLFSNEADRVFFVEAAQAIPPSKCQIDPQFPRLVEIADPLSHAVQVADKRNQTDSLTRFASIFSGRALYERPINGGEELGSWDKKFLLMVKSTGVPRCVRQRWEEYGEDSPPFFLGGKAGEGDTQRSLTRTETFHGIATREDQLMDALGSVELYRAGVRVRMPIAGWRVEELQNDGQTLTIDKARAKGFAGDVLYQSLWAVSCPFRIEDVLQFLGQEIRNGAKSTNIDKLLNILLFLAARSSDVRYKGFSKLYKYDVESSLKSQKPLPSSVRSSILITFGSILCEIMGENYDAMYQAKLTHGNLHDQNITFFGEICDNSTVKEGALKIGLAPENSADIDGFRSSMRKFAVLIVELIELEEKENLNDAKTLLETVFYPAVKRKWTTYERFVKEQIDREAEKINENYKKRVLETGEEFSKFTAAVELETSYFELYARVFG